MRRIGGAMNRLKELFQKQAIPKMKEKFGYKNDLCVPKVEMIVINIGVGATVDQKFREIVIKNLMAITAQKPIETKAKKSIAGFKVRKGQNIGLKVTLRGNRMYDFLDKLINIALPRIKDFKGVPRSFDSHGNLNLGIKEHIVFPEIEEGTEKIYSLQLTIVTTAKTDEEAKELLNILGMPFKE